MLRIITLSFFFFFLAALGLCYGTQAFSSCGENPELPCSGARALGSAAVYRLGCSKVCRILVLRPGIKPVSPALAGKFLTTSLGHPFPNYCLESLRGVCV